MNTLIIFIKYPEPGRVKTRLARDVGETKAAQIYSLLAKTIIEKTFDPENFSTVIFYDPAGKEKEIRNWVSNEEVQYSPQIGNNLGEKISNAFEEVFSSGAKRAIIIGSDCIDFNNETVFAAIKSLDDNDVIVGPAVDGGYYLLGLKKYIPEIFEDIEWSTDKVLDQTIQKIETHKLKYKRLKTLKDIDTVDDLYEANIDYSGIENLIS